MFKELDYKIIVGIVIITVLLVGGTYYFSQRSYKHFASEIGATTQNNKPDTDSVATTSSDQDKSTQTPNSVHKAIKTLKFIKKSYFFQNYGFFS